jgi:hypothetical protein
MQHIDEMTIPHAVTTVDTQPAVWVAGPNCVRHEVVGEVYNPEHMRRVVAGVQGRTDAVVPAWLMPEPQNPHDSSAVVVWVFGGKVGYLPRELAVQWHPILVRLRSRYGFHVGCQATIDPPSAANQGGFGMIVWLPGLPMQQPVPPQRVPAPAQAPVPPRRVPAPAQPPVSAPLSAQSPVSAPVSAQPAVSAPVRSSPQVAQFTAKPATPPPTPEQIAQLRGELAKVHAALDVAKQELYSVEEAIEIQSFGFYKPKYGFESSAQYTARLKGIRDEQQALIKQDKAAPCDTKWSVGGSAAEGKKMVKQQAKLMLRAFNGECDAAIAKVRYDNAATLEQRLTKAYEDINKLGEVQRVFISRRYFELKLAELHLVHEHREKVQQEKEEQKRIKEQMREEQKAQEEIDRAKAEAEKEEAQSAAALEKARAELAAAESTSKQHERLEGLVTRLETELKEALDRKAKAIARAQLTKSGHVYVLSNVGSFGDGVFKIGMTRRLDPIERVEELGDASVPFPFDVHAIIYSADAPALEAKLHQAFASRRVNVINLRKEYFRVTLDEIQVEVKKLHGLVTFQLTAEAEEYRKTLAAAAAGAVVSPAEVALAAPET